MGRELSHIIYIRNALAEIHQWISQGETAFKDNVVVVKATLYNLQTLAESASLLPQEWRDEHPNVDWVEIKAFRNFLAHQYMDIDVDMVWIAITRSLPGLDEAIEAIAHDHFNQDHELG